LLAFSHLPVFPSAARRGGQFHGSDPMGQAAVAMPSELLRMDGALRSLRAAAMTRAIAGTARTRVSCP
jgi:hypothetical protein